MNDYAIFYDLETSDQNPIGQILNFSFICVDRDYKVVDEYSNNVYLSRLQLPSPGAILANRIDVLKHQQGPGETEKSASLNIAKFIEKQLKLSRKIPLVGYNSTRFDLPFLRTSLIRNGINPYFMGNIIYKDLLQAARKLSVSNKEFPRKEGAPKRDPAANTENRLSLTLETLTNHFGLLQGKQVHSSREDVVITIKLAKLFKEKFSLDVCEYDAYEAAPLHETVRQGIVYNQLVPEYDLTTGKINLKIPHTLLDMDYKYSLWIDLDKYRNGLGKRSISWFSRQTSTFFTDLKQADDTKLKECAINALNEFRTVNLKNFFEKSTCDIEQDIYRLDISMIGNLFDVIWQSNRAGSKDRLNKEAKVILLRNELANYAWGNKNDQSVCDILKQYSLHRYGGKMKINKFSDADQHSPEGADIKHVTFAELMRQTELPENNSNPEDQNLMASLRQYYHESDIYRLCSAELLA